MKKTPDNHLSSVQLLFNELVKVAGMDFELLRTELYVEKNPEASQTTKNQNQELSLITSLSQIHPRSRLFLRVIAKTGGKTISISSDLNVTDDHKIVPENKKMVYEHMDSTKSVGDRIEWKKTYNHALQMVSLLSCVLGIFGGFKDEGEVELPSTAESLLQSGLIGLWKDRRDIKESETFARQLRQQAQHRRPE